MSPIPTERVVHLRATLKEEEQMRESVIVMKPRPGV